MATRRSRTAKSATVIGRSPGPRAIETCFCTRIPRCSSARRTRSSSGEPTPASYASIQGFGSNTSHSFRGSGRGGTLANAESEGSARGQERGCHPPGEPRLRGAEGDRVEVPEHDVAVAEPDAGRRDLAGDHLLRLVIEVLIMRRTPCIAD